MSTRPAEHRALFTHSRPVGAGGGGRPLCRLTGNHYMVIVQTVRRLVGRQGGPATINHLLLMMR